MGISALELGEDAGRTSDRDEPLRPLLKLETLMLLSGIGLPRRHGGVTPRSDTTVSRAPDSEGSAGIYKYFARSRERNADFHVSGLFEMTPLPLAHT